MLLGIYMIKYCNNSSTQRHKINTGKRVKQIDIILLNLFIKVLESVFQKINWEVLGVSINEKHFKYL